MLTTNRKTSVELLNSTVILKTLYCCAARFTEIFIRTNGISFEGINTYFNKSRGLLQIPKNWSSLSVLTQEIVIIIIITRKNIFNILVFMIIHCILFCQVKQFAKSYIVIWIADFILNCHLVCYFISKFYIQLDLHNI